MTGANIKLKIRRISKTPDKKKSLLIKMLLCLIAKTRRKGISININTPKR
jgi:hypothetical protein